MFRQHSNIFRDKVRQRGDTHIENVNIDSSIAALRKVDFVPFEKGIKAGADFVMVSHISVSRVTETAQPASMSELIMKTILREELGFEGVIITDAMDMASITDKYSSEEACTRRIRGRCRYNPYAYGF